MALISYLQNAVITTEKDLGEEHAKKVWLIIELVLDDIFMYLKTLKPKRQDSGFASLLPSEEEDEEEKEEFDRQGTSGVFAFSTNFLFRDCFGVYEAEMLFTRFIFHGVVPLFTIIFEKRLPMPEGRKQALSKDICKCSFNLLKLARDDQSAKRTKKLLQVIEANPLMNEFVEGIRSKVANLYGSVILTR